MVQHKKKGGTVERLPFIGHRFYMDFGFMRVSTSDYTQPDAKRDHVVQSFDGFNSYLLIVNEASHVVWILLCKSKDPPIDEASTFLSEFGLRSGGLIRYDRGGELARLDVFVTAMQK